MSVKRTDKLSSLLEQKISEYLTREMEFSGIVSISQVKPAPNMQVAIVWISVFGTDEELVLKQIRKEAGSIRKYLKKELFSQYTPRLFFRLDPSEAYADHINSKLKDLEND